MVVSMLLSTGIQEPGRAKEQWLVGVEELMVAAKTSLAFSEPILSTSEQLVSTSELLTRLAALHEELSLLVQDEVDLSTIDGYKDDLVSRKLLKHKNMGVRAFVACCLSDILRLYAPDAPYTDTQLTDIFKLVLSQFEQLGEPENGYNIQQTYLITRLLEYRSIVLLTDLPTSNKLVEELFEVFYNSSRSYHPQLYKVIAGILGEVISEFDAVPMSVLKLVFNKFLTYDSANVPKGLEVASNCGYEISLILCTVFSSRMSRHFTKYYSEILYNITNTENGSFENSKIMVSRTLEKLHRLTLKIWETVPELVSSVVGFVYHELSSDNEILRINATKFVGDILGTASDVNFVTTYQDAFNTWVSKIADISSEVRVQWVQTIATILTIRDDISDEINKGLAKTLIDSDNRVRKASVMVFAGLDINTIWKSITYPSVYTSLLHLTREKGKDVREQAIYVVADLYSGSLDKIPRIPQNKDIWDIIDTIPSTLFDLYYINDLNINEQVDKVIFEKLLPFEIDSEKRVNRMLVVMTHFDKKAFSSFFAFNKRQLQMSLAFTKFVELCEQLTVANDEEEDRSAIKTQNAIKLQKTMEWLAMGLSDQMKTVAALEALKELNDNRIFYLIRTCVANEVTFATLKNCLKEVTVKLEDPALFRKHHIDAISTIVPRDIARQVKMLLYRSSPILYNVSNIPFLLENGSRHTSPDFSSLKRKLVDHISEISPNLFKDQVKSMAGVIKDSDLSTLESGAPALQEALKTFYKISKSLKDETAFDDVFFYTKLHDLAIEGTPGLAKYAVKILAMSQSSAFELEKLKNQIIPLNCQKDKNFASHILVLAEIMKFAPQILDSDSTDIVSYLIKEVLLNNQVVGNSKKEEEWVDEDMLLNSREYIALSSKVFTLKLFATKLNSIAPDASKDKLTKAFIKKTMKLFFYLIASGGELISEYNKENYPTPNNYQTKLRSYAALQLLSLAKVSTLNDFIKPSDVIKLINIVEDESFPVRNNFLDRLREYISAELISIKFLPLVFFTAYEPESYLKASIKTWINVTFGRPAFKRGTFFERCLPRLIHTISHHPDVIEGLRSTGDGYLNALTTSIDYLIFYFDSIASQENFSLLYYLSERVKNYQDKVKEDEDEEDSNAEQSDHRNNTKNENNFMYIVSELSQMILLQLKARKGWQHVAYPGKLNLPNDLFQPFQTVEEAQASFKTYIPGDLTEKLQNNIRTKVNRSLQTSQTQRQKVQKRMLASEYQEPAKKKKTVKSATSRSQKASNEHMTDSENEDSNSEDSPYTPAKNKKVFSTYGRKKNLRARKEVNYKDSDEEADDNVQNGDDLL